MLVKILVCRLGAPPREWIRTYARDSSQTNKPVTVRMTSDDRCIVAGSSQNSTNDLDYILLKYKSQGDVEWLYRYDSGGDDELRSAVTDNETNVVATGTSRSPSGQASRPATMDDGESATPSAKSHGCCCPGLPQRSTSHGGNRRQSWS